MKWITIFKNRWVQVSIFIILSASAVICSIKCLKIGTAISALGSIASLYAIIEALIRVKTIEEQNVQIKDAVDSKITSLNKQETTEQINKYIETIARILSYIEVRNAEAALLKIEELQFFLHNIQSNPTSTDDTRKTFSRYLKTIKQDALVLRDKNQFEQFPKDADCTQLNKHFEDLRDSLMSYSQQIHFDK